MKGIHCARQGRLGQDVELRTSAAGKDWCRLSVGVGEDDDLTWVSVAVFEEKARALAGLAKGVRRGTLVPERLDRPDGAERTGVSVSAWQVMPLGQIGRRKPKVQSRDEQDTVPFDDPLRF
jgi:hypothetical protein